MKIAVLSGKGGTGKTFVSVNLASVAKNCVYVDCDIEEPNGRLFLNPDHVQKEEVNVLVPEIHMDLCTGCRKCIDFCNANAIAFMIHKFKVFNDICQNCGGCSLVCESQAIKEIPVSRGHIETGDINNIKVITGVLNIGEESGVPVIKKALEKAKQYNKDYTIIDCPPGSACTVMESVNDADYCILVAEPTIFGLHNLKMIVNLVTILNVPFGIVINKYDDYFEQLEEYCKNNNIPILAKIPHDKEIAELISKGRIAVNEKQELKDMFSFLLKQLGGIL